MWEELEEPEQWELSGWKVLPSSRLREELAPQLRRKLSRGLKVAAAAAAIVRRRGRERIVMRVLGVDMGVGDREG